MYSDAEFALVLQKAAELANTRTPRSTSPAGMTLAEMKSIASEAGIDAALVERAAQIVAASATTSFYERVVGGPVRHGGVMQLPVKLDEAHAARLLAAVQILADDTGTGHASATGMVWHARNDMETLRVTAQPAEDGTTVAVRVDRTGVLAFVHIAGLISSVAAVAGGIVVADQVAPIVGVAAGVTGIGSVLAVARAYWASSTRQVRSRIEDLMEAIERSVERPAQLPPDAGEHG